MARFVAQFLSLVMALYVFALPDAHCQFNMNKVMMEWTFRIHGPFKEKDKTYRGSAFVMGIPKESDPDTGDFVLVTAKHVLENIVGNTATVDLRERKDDGRIEVVPYEIKIRDNLNILWTSHATADIAVLRIQLPLFVADQARTTPLPSIEMLADDETLAYFEILPGDELSVVGYPLGADVDGFGILRSGKIASFPQQAGDNKSSFFLDFEVFGGNSGGPVYLVDRSRTYQGSTHLGETVSIVVGLVSRQHEQLRLALVVPAQQIRETLEKVR